MSIRVLYFGELREQIGSQQEELTWPDLDNQPFTVQDLIAQLASRHVDHARALNSDQPLKVAVNQEMARLNTLIPDQAEVAFFRPVTGG